MSYQNTTDPKIVKDDETVESQESTEQDSWDDEFDNHVGDLIIF